MLLVAASPALAEIGCIADASIHARVEGPQAFAEAEAAATNDSQHREPAGHSAACHLSHASHSQLASKEGVVAPASDALLAEIYWGLVTDRVDGRDPDGMIRPPRA